MSGCREAPAGVSDSSESAPACSGNWNAVAISRAMPTIDLQARERYEEYGRARDTMFAATHTEYAPWFVVEFDDQRLEAALTKE